MTSRAAVDPGLTGRGLEELIVAVHHHVHATTHPLLALELLELDALDALDELDELAELEEELELLLELELDDDSAGTGGHTSGCRVPRPPSIEKRQ